MTSALGELAAIPANDNGRRNARRVPAIVDLGVEVFAGLLTHLEDRGSITAAEFSDLVRRRCREHRPGPLEDRPEVATLLKIADELSPASPPHRSILILLGAGDDARR